MSNQKDIQITVFSPYQFQVSIVIEHLYSANRNSLKILFVIGLLYSTIVNSLKLLFDHYFIILNSLNLLFGQLYSIILNNLKLLFVVGHIYSITKQFNVITSHWSYLLYYSQEFKAIICYWTSFLIGRQ